MCSLCDACVCRIFAVAVFYEWVINYPIMWWITWVIFLLIDYSLQKKWLMVTFSFLLSFGTAPNFSPPWDEWVCASPMMMTLAAFNTLNAHYLCASHTVCILLNGMAWHGICINWSTSSEQNTPCNQYVWFMLWIYTSHSGGNKLISVLHNSIERTNELARRKVSIVI